MLRAIRPEEFTIHLYSVKSSTRLAKAVSAIFALELGRTPGRRGKSGGRSESRGDDPCRDDDDAQNGDLAEVRRGESHSRSHSRRALLFQSPHSFRILAHSADYGHMELVVQKLPEKSPDKMCYASPVGRGLP